MLSHHLRAAIAPRGLHPALRLHTCTAAHTTSSHTAMRMAPTPPAPSPVPNKPIIAAVAMSSSGIGGNENHSRPTARATGQHTWCCNVCSPSAWQRMHGTASAPIRREMHQSYMIARKAVGIHWGAGLEITVVTSSEAPPNPTERFCDATCTRAKPSVQQHLHETHLQPQ